jgi:hypothetical protein
LFRYSCLTTLDVLGNEAMQGVALTTRNY